MGNFSIHEAQAEIVDALKRTPRLILEAPTGSGKSTQVPQMILDHGLAGGRQIVVLQPRRLAARMLARWVAQSRGVALGSEVGYQVRLENRSSGATRIKFETEGVILRQALSDPALGGVGALVFDEFHERHVHADVMLPIALELQRGPRPDLKIVVMSATLDSRRLQDALAPCAVVRSSGRTFPVEVRYLAREPRADRNAVWQLAADALAEGLVDGPPGHGLVFMPGAYEIHRTLDALREVPAARGCAFLPLHGDLPADAQDEAVAPSERRKVVVATNIAETSLTIDGVSLVIDSGLARKAAFDPVRGINTLLVEKICRAPADQRAGRAGRTRPGRCVRLWTEADHAARPEQETPEIQRIDLAEVVLALKGLGVRDVASFPWLDAPRAESLDRSFALLRDLGALDASGGLTDLGRTLMRFPLHPRHARMLVAGAAEGCLREAALVAAMSQERELLLGRQARDVAERRERALGEDHGSDVLLGVRAWEYARRRDFDLDDCRALGIHAQTARRVGAIAGQFAAMAAEAGLSGGGSPSSPSALQRAILSGFSDQFGRRVSAVHRRYALVHGRRGTLDKDSAVGGAEFIVAGEIHEIGRVGGEVEVRLGQATAVESEWVRELFPGDWSERREIGFDPAVKRVVVKRRVYFRDLLLEEKTSGEPEAEEAARVLAGEIAQGHLILKQWDHRVEQWASRVNLLAQHCPELGLPPVTAEARRDLLEQVCLGAFGYKDVKDRPVWPAVRGWLSAEQHAQVDRLAPARLALSNGRSAAVTYAEGQAPHIALRVQELYGVDKPIAIAMGRVRVRVHVLAPNQRPVQVTDDLGSFWANTYEQVKKELRGRYPKHEWR